jgi:hypothetical protein
MANAKFSATNYEYATVDTQPTSAGYWTNEVSPRDKFKKGAGKLFFSIREASADVSANPSALSVITVSLQFKCKDDPGWTDYVPLDSSSLAIGNRVALEDVGADVRWRAGVVDDAFTNGSVRFGFDW